VSAITSEPLPSIAMQPVCVGDDQLTELAAQLKPSRGPAPKTEMVKAALALARDPSLVAAAVAPKGGHDRARKLSLRILELGLLPAAAPPATAPPTAPPATAPDADEAENKPPQAATADVMTERKLKHAEARPCSQAEAQGRYMAKQRARQEREAYSRDWLELTKAEQAAASCFGFATCELWEDRLNRSAHSFSAEGHAIDLQGDKWLLPWANLTTEDRAATRMYILLHRVLHHRVLLYRVLHIELYGFTEHYFIFHIVLSVSDNGGPSRQGDYHLTTESLLFWLLLLIFLVLLFVFNTVDTVPNRS
jgi:hypothetical protein